MSLYTNNNRIESSPWLQLQSFKSQAISRIDDIDELLNNVSFYEGDTITDALHESLCGSSGRLYEFTSLEDSADLTITVKDIKEDGSGYKDTDITKTISGFFSTADSNRDLTVDIGNGLNLSNVLLDIVEARNFNNAIVEVTRALQCSVHISLSDITSTFQQYTDLALSEVREFISTCRNSLSNAKLTAQSWLGVLHSMFTVAETTLDDGSTYLDMEQPFAYQSLISMIVSVGVSIVSTVASALLSIISPIVSLLVISFGGIIQTVINQINNAENPVAIDSAAVTNLVKGPVVYAELTSDQRDSLSYWQEWFSGITSADGVACMPFGPFLHFGFMPKERGYLYDSQYFNSYLAVQWNWRKVLHHILTYPGAVYLTTYDDDVHYNPSLNVFAFRFWVDAINDIFTNPDYYYTTEEANAVMSNPDECLVNLYMGLTLWNLFGRITKYQATTSSTGYFVSTGSPIRTDIDQFSVQYQYGLNNVPEFKLTTTTESDRFIDWRFIMGFFAHYFYFDGQESDIDLAISYALSSKTRRSLLHQAIINFYENGVKVYCQHGYNIGIYNDFGVVDNFPQYNYGKMNTGLITDQMCYHRPGLTYPDVMCFPVDSVPPDRSLSVNGITFAELETEIILSAAVITAATVGAVSLSRYIKKRSILKRTSRAHDLETLRDAYNSNPSAENAKAYSKAVKQYNLKGKLFGWGSYDAANGWFDGPSNQSSSSLTDAIVSGKEGNVLTSLQALTSTGIGGEGTIVNPDNISRVISLIKG